MSQDAALETAQNLRAALKSWGYKPKLEKSKYAYYIDFVVPEKDKRTVISVIERHWKGVKVAPMDRKRHITGVVWTMTARIPRTTVKKSTTKKRSTKKTSTKKPSKPTKPKARTKRKTTTRKIVKKKKKSVNVKKLMKCIFSSS